MSRERSSGTMETTRPKQPQEALSACYMPMGPNDRLQPNEPFHTWPAYALAIWQDTTELQTRHSLLALADG